MFSPRPNLAFLLLLNLFLALSPVHAAPVQRRQDPTGATTLMTQSTTDTAAGEMTQTCVITLTPVTDAHGNQEVQEVKTCTVTMNSVNNSGSSSSSNGTDSSSSSSTDSSSSSTDSSGSSSTDSSGSSSTDTTGSTTTDAGSGSGSASTTAAGVIANGVSTVAVSGTGTDSSVATSTSDSSQASATSASDSSQASATSSSGSGGAGAVAGSLTTIPISAVSSAAANAPPAATAAAENNAASPSTSAFTVPGQSIQVLPIGLGVFAGISVIALIVVGLVTYERTKYRKAFRARKLAESGAAMGYGGMAQR